MLNISGTKDESKCSKSETQDSHNPKLKMGVGADPGFFYMEVNPNGWRQPIVQHNFPEMCMKIKKIGQGWVTRPNLSI